MSEFGLYITLALAFAVLLLWLMRPRRTPLQRGDSPIDQAFESISPNHYLYLPQIRQALSAADYKYLREEAPPHVARRALRERRAIARRFLSGLHEDFSKLELLARMIAGLSPAISKKQEAERLLLGLQFRMVYALVWIRLSTGRIPMRQIDDLTGLVGRLALRMQQAIAEVNALSAGQLPGDASA